jgi:PTS system galactitol-specific IIA component
MNVEEILKEDLIFTRKHFENKEEVIRFLAEQLKQKGYVHETFADAVVEREEKYPTGLYLGRINVAIPHTDTKHVKQSGVAILTLDNPVIFNKMDDPSQTIPVLIIFLLAVSEPKEYTKFLARLVGSFSDKVFIQKIYDASSPWQLLNLVRHALQLERDRKDFVGKEVRDSLERDLRRV